MEEYYFKLKTEENNTVELMLFAAESDDQHAEFCRISVAMICGKATV